MAVLCKYIYTQILFVDISGAPCCWTLLIMLD